MSCSDTITVTGRSPRRFRFRCSRSERPRVKPRTQSPRRLELIDTLLRNTQPRTLPDLSRSNYLSPTKKRKASRGASSRRMVLPKSRGKR
jgi:hypothetical protein